MKFAFYTPYIVFLVIIFCLPSVAAEVITDDEVEKLESEDLPEVVKAKVVDITHIKLEPRNRFEDNIKPEIGQSFGIYPKERLWNLPNILTPSQAVLKKLTEPDNYLVSLEASPRLPSSWSYDVLFAGDFQPMRGLINIESQHLDDKFTNDKRGEYYFDKFYATMGYSKDFDIDAEFKYETKALEWLRINQVQDNVQTIGNNLAFLKGDLDFYQWITDKTQIALDLDGVKLGIDEDSNNDNDYSEALNLRLNLDIATYWPFINPINFGGQMDYFSAVSNAFLEKRKVNFSTFKLYFKNNYSALGPFVFTVIGELISTRERDDKGEDQTKLFFNPTMIVTTKFSENVILQSRLERLIKHEPLSEMYFYQDYINVNPYLRMSKIWNALLSLKYKDILGISGFVQKADDLDVLFPSEQYLEQLDTYTLFWYPDNIDALLYGTEISLNLSIDKLDLLAKYIHEFQEPENLEYIPYRPADFLKFNIAYNAKYRIRFEFGGKFCGPRYISVLEDEKLDSYFIGRVKLSKAIGKYAIIFIGAQFGEYETLKDYKFSENFVDFGVKIKI